MGNIHTKAELAQAFGVSATTAQNWTRRAAFPGGPHGPWDEALIGRYLRATRSPSAPPGEAGEPENVAAVLEAEIIRLRAEVERLTAAAEGRDEFLRQVDALFGTLWGCLPSALPSLELGLLPPNVRHLVATAWTSTIERSRANFKRARDRLVAEST